MLTQAHQKLIKWIDNEVKKQKFGTANLTVMVQNGEPLLDTITMVKMRRRKYKQTP